MRLCKHGKSALSLNFRSFIYSLPTQQDCVLPVPPNTNKVITSFFSLEKADNEKMQTSKQSHQQQIEIKERKREKIPLRGFSLRLDVVTRCADTRFTIQSNKNSTRE